MSKLNTALKSVPAIDKQELLFYIAAHYPDCALRINTDSGVSYEGVLLTIGKVKNEEVFLIFQITEERNRFTHLTNRFVHLSLHKIASIELIDPADLVSILSLGKITKR